MGISVLGPLTLDDSAPRLGPRDTVVLAALAAAGDEALSADELAEAVWGDTPPASWHKNLQSCVVRLRKVLGAGAIETTGTGTGSPSPPTLSTRASSRRSPSAATSCSSSANRTGRRTPSARRWPCGAVARSPSSRSGSPAAWKQPGSPSSVSTPRSGGSRHPSRPATTATCSPRRRPWPTRPRCGSAGGSCSPSPSTEPAVRARRCAPSPEVRRRLVDELGIDPGPGLDELEGAILRQDPDLDVASVRQHAQRGLPLPRPLPYDVEDEEGFFGRDRDIRLCRERLDEEGVLAVLGPSGSGKSSLVRAGIVAALRREGQHSDVITPGRAPRRRPPPPRPTGKPRLLVVDQAEELFSLCHDDQRSKTGSSSSSPTTPKQPLWSWSSAPTGWETSPPTPPSPASSSAGCTSSPP